MKILQVFDFLSPTHGGGTVLLVAKLAMALRGRGHDVAVYTSDYQLDRGYLATLGGIRITLFRCVFKAAGFYYQPGMIKQAREHLRDFDIIHLHCARSFQNAVIHHYAIKYGIPYVIDAHGSLPRLSPGNKGIKWLLKWLFDAVIGQKLLRDARRVIAETQLGIDEYLDFGVPRERIVMITPPFPTEDFADLPPRGAFRREYNITEKHVVMFLGRINWIKGLDFLVESFAELAKVRDDVLLVIVGPDDGYQRTLMELTSKLGIGDRVRFPGFRGGRDKLAALVDADVVIQTSVYEQGAWVPFEAVLCHTPVIVSGNSGAGEDVRKIDAGYLVEYGNTAELSNMIQYVLDNPEEARAKTSKAKGYIEANLSMARGVDNYIKVYSEIIGGAKS